MVTLAMSLLASATVTPPTGAAVPRLIGKATVCPNPKVRLTGRTMPPGEATVTLAVAFGTLGSPVVAVIVAVPVALPVTGTLTLVASAGIVTEDGTLATAELLEPSPMTMPPAGAGAESVNLRFCVPAPAKVRLAGKKLRDAPTCTCWLVEPKPKAEAVNVIDPKLMPLNRGAENGAVWPSRI